ncbi:hypothetical protein KOM00_01945 [Geomonas sp. Red69]|uniref:hypothetical protein n=1 Tax=Geomonas diazotrophica TaxID=2843197 RepID=UPI001C1030D5|nr:hypothetical protein [Geomonas diazotrophica]MBU5635488.1 hypothetical protein [Geomonas diazotrophica]
MHPDQLGLFEDMQQGAGRALEEGDGGAADGLAADPEENAPLRDTGAMPGWTITVKVTITCHEEKAKGGGACSGY